MIDKLFSAGGAQTTVLPPPAVYVWPASYAAGGGAWAACWAMLYTPQHARQPEARHTKTEKGEQQGQKQQGH